MFSKGFFVDADSICYPLVSIVYGVLYETHTPFTQV